MSGEGPDGRKPDIRLSPPPRIGPVGSKLRHPTSSRADGTLIPADRRGRPWWAVPLAFALLGLAAVAAYVFFDVGERLASSQIGPERVAVSPAPTTEAPTGDEEESLAPSHSGSERGSSPAPTTDARTGDAEEGLAPSRSQSERAGSNPASTTDATRIGPATDEPEFGRLMAAGLSAIESGDWQTARASFARAATMRPDSPEPAAGLARVEAAAGRVTIEEHRVRALRLVGAEEWKQAAAEYRAALEIDRTLTFAQDGLRLAEARGSLSDRLASHLERPERLSASAVLSEVDRLLETAGTIEDAGPRHAAQVAALEELASLVRLPVLVSLRSDALTEVTVHQVGRLGAFSQRELELRPGVYTIVGSRAGYRDVRRQLKVEPGTPPEPLEIRCEERI